MKQVPILKSLSKIPAGNLVVPMFITAIVNTIFPSALAIGDLTSAIFSSQGTLTIIGLVVFVAGLQTTPKDFAVCLRRGGLMMVLRVLLGVALGIFLIKIFPLEGFWGLPLIALIPVLVSMDPGLYLSASLSYGDKTDLAAFSLANVLSTPVIGEVLLCVASGSNINVMQTFLACLLPFFVGMLIGNLDHQFRAITENATSWLLIFLGFVFGSTINLVDAAKAGAQGLLLAAIFIGVSLPFLLFVDKKILKRPGYAGASLVGISGIAVAVPGRLMAVDPIFAETGLRAIPIIALAMIIVYIVSPFITKAVVKKWGDSKNMSPPCS